MAADEGIDYFDDSHSELKKEFKVIEQFEKRNSGTDGGTCEAHTSEEDK